MKKNSVLKITALLLVLVMASMTLSSCMTNRHTVGNGPQTGIVEKSRQWYVLWGLVNLGDQDTKSMVGYAADYKIETYYSGVDWLINLFLGWLSIQSRTIKVTK
ncbi:hypothetical protein E4O03_11745 [Treponema sp. OMZ 792]|uniref:Bor/Iss family lipoprotein n=1 Tax=unclassified Treponema TaxID=2638727 RepID=UPI0020A2EFFE|nr:MULTISPECIES: hypothetical protein [unclassified Treponema]UTC74853.1 hypothetical protein E4O03_11745 [Treponema sp. OMZ 792]UTC76803.1 hypothetical protein E4O04_01725 [Treponema sp. OMZ 799]UTC81246.1 hypothetical protein E4O07_11655 [Treponema sp. OMZ 798]